MTYEDLLATGDRDEILAVLDIADRVSLSERGHAVRDFRDILSGRIPEPDDLSTYSDAVVRLAIRMRAAGETATPLTGKEPDAVLSAVLPHLCPDALAIARDAIQIEAELDLIGDGPFARFLTPASGPSTPGA